MVAWRRVSERLEKELATSVARCEELQTELNGVPVENFEQALEEAAANVKHLRRRVDIEDRLEQTWRQRKDLEEEHQEKLDDQLQRVRILVGIGMMFVFGFVLLLSGMSSWLKGLVVTYTSQPLMVVAGYFLLFSLAYGVLLFSLGRSVMPVDTHVLRVSKRLGLLPQEANAGRAHHLLQAAVPENLVYSFHLNLIQHGRTTCKARNPSCKGCSLRRLCPAYPILPAQHSRKDATQ